MYTLVSETINLRDDTIEFWGLPRVLDAGLCGRNIINKRIVAPTMLTLLRALQFPPRTRSHALFDTAHSGIRSGLAVCGKSHALSHLLKAYVCDTSEGGHIVKVLIGAIKEHLFRFDRCYVLVLIKLINRRKKTEKSINSSDSFEFKFYIFTKSRNTIINIFWRT